ncbi:MFS transporter [Streptomyces sp. TS71-3]|uniref:MFS transporter n=1 Tax=Streptomyces sp. TS71-3 TaxID=2733862 RepID=UPI001B043898|nr:MFS transporter [Streptomyces sp. TS71-3]GHJ36894.1 hypothetical protein Sm713_25030 [Streptomyces sp. TS71-3]
MTERQAGTGTGTGAEPSPPASPAAPRRRIYAMGFLDAFGLGMYLSFSAVYLSKAVGMSNYSVGLVMGVAGVASVVGAIPIGRFADRRGPRRALIVLFYARALSYVGLALAADLWTAVLAAAFGGLLNRGIGPLVQSALITGLGQEEAVVPLARMRSVRTAAMAIGALPAGAAIALGEVWAYRAIMGAAAVFFAVCAVLATTLPTDRGRAKMPGRPGLVGNGAFLGVTLLFGALTMSALLFEVGMSLWITQSTHAPAWCVTMNYVLNSVLIVAFQTRMSRGSESPGTARRMMTMGGFLAAAGAALAPLSAVGSGWVAVLSLLPVAALMTAAEIYVMAGATSLALVHTPLEHRSTYLATFNLGFGAATVVGPTLISVTLGLGTAGWLAWAAFFVVAGAAARTVPLKAREEAVQGAA